MRGSATLVVLIVAIAALFALPLVLTAQPEVRVEFGPGLPLEAGPPIYAQISKLVFGWEIYHDGKWAAIPFYRDPGCVRPDFNLLDMFDPPIVFDCAWVVQGFEIWRTPMTVPPPIKVRIWGLGAVPIYFVKWEKLQAAVADNVLTMPELNALVAAGEGVVGLATFYSSELHPSGGTAVPHFDVSAHGRLSNGKRFQFQVAGGDLTALIKHIKIVFE